MGEVATELPPFPGAPEIYEARLKLEARHDPMAALAKLPEIVLEVGAPELDSGIAAVVSRVVTTDRAAAWALTRDLRWAHGRALALEGIARVEPRGRDRARHPGLARRVAQSRSEHRQVAIRRLHPCKSSSRHLRARPSSGPRTRCHRGPRTIPVRDPRGDSSRDPAREHGRRSWTPEYWDMWTATSHDGAAAELPAAAALPDIESAALGAWWKLGTLPLHELPRARPEGDGLP